MTDYFFDSSALAKLYHQESGMQWIESIVRTPGNRIIVSRLATVEICSSFAIKVRNREITRPEGLKMVRVFERDIASRRFDVDLMSNSDFDQAGELIERYALDHRLRSLDALQLAVALKLSKAGGLDYFVAADKVLCDVAALEGLAVINPDTA